MVKAALVLLLTASFTFPVMAGEWHADRVTTELVSLPREKAPEGGLPDGYLAIAEAGSDVTSAWYTKPTTRYSHGILGDAIEGGSLVVKTTKGKVLEFVLPDNQVFEDITPRLVDLGTTGNQNIITILSDIKLGASLAVFGVVSDKLSLIAQTPYIGRTNRWRNIAGFGDFDGDGKTQIAEVVTPHIGGVLQFWTWDKNKLLLSGEMSGFSNHFIGSREQELSTLEDFDDDGVSDLALPSADRKSLRLMKFSGKARGKKTLEELANIPLSARIDKKISAVFTDGRVVITVGLEDGSVWKIQQ